MTQQDEEIKRIDVLLRPSKGIKDQDTYVNVIQLVSNYLKNKFMPKATTLGVVYNVFVGLLQQRDIQYKYQQSSVLLLLYELILALSRVWNLQYDSNWTGSRTICKRLLHQMNHLPISKGIRTLLHQFAQLLSYCWLVEGHYVSSRQILVPFEQSGNQTLDITSSFLVALAYLQSKDYREATDRLRGILSRSTIQPRPSVFYMLGYVLYLQQDFTGAQECLKTSQEMDYRVMESAILLGIIEQDSNLAHRHFKRALQSSSNKALSSFNLGSLYASQGNWMAQQKSLRSCLDKTHARTLRHPSSVLLHSTVRTTITPRAVQRELALAAINTGDYKTANSAFQTLLPDLASELSRGEIREYIYVLLQTNQHLQAYELAQSLELSADAHDRSMDIGVVLYKIDALMCLNRLEEALLEAEKLEAVAAAYQQYALPGEVLEDVFNNLSLLYVCGGQLNKAITCLRKLKAIVSRNTKLDLRVAFNLASLLLRVNDIAGAALEWFESREFQLNQPLEYYNKHKKQLEMQVLCLKEEPLEHHIHSNQDIPSSQILLLDYAIMREFVKLENMASVQRAISVTKSFFSKYDAICLPRNQRNR